MVLINQITQATTAFNVRPATLWKNNNKFINSTAVLTQIYESKDSSTDSTWCTRYIGNAFDHLSECHFVSLCTKFYPWFKLRCTFGCLSNYNQTASLPNSSKFLKHLEPRRVCCHSCNRNSRRASHTKRGSYAMQHIWKSLREYPL